MGQDSNNEIEKKIEATLPRTEQVVTHRGRKASHYMRIFDQGHDSVGGQVASSKPSADVSGRNIPDLKGKVWCETSIECS